MIKKYSLKKDGHKKVLTGRVNISVRELACKDGSDKVLYNTELKKYLMRAVRLMRQLYGYDVESIHISSAYRTAAHNRRVGGASRSQHLTGSAIDAMYTCKNGSKVPSNAVAASYQIADAPGIEILDSYHVHVDCRKGATWKAKVIAGSIRNVNTFIGIRPKIMYKGNLYNVYGYRVIGNRYRVRIGGKLKWVRP